MDQNVYMNTDIILVARPHLGSSILKPADIRGRDQEKEGDYIVGTAFALHGIPLGERSVLIGAPIPLSFTPKNSKIGVKGLHA